MLVNMVIRVRLRLSSTAASIRTESNKVIYENILPYFTHKKITQVKTKICKNCRNFLLSVKSFFFASFYSHNFLAIFWLSSCLSCFNVNRSPI